MSQGNKVYGLILPKKQGQVKSQPSTVASVFQDDSDEEDRSTGPVAPYKVATSSTKIKRQTQMDIDKALQEDPNIYEYDEVYDQMQASKPQVGFKEKDKTKVDRKPKYIAGLLKAADVKKKEDERRLERKV
ncbi:nuclear speckle splicing regulatory protein 1 [Plakobranchus ocellatus]|uniref:Nuclear speckle splicing regulatory protein 1 n=1 Tax=Plakobranchus ocellatus TaxID=259542 RepID=A0AAV3YSM9_9GAST|nr:nuclear speckle splicing regulatory protein 1 [Plakobranchus ocellatus]